MDRRKKQPESRKILLVSLVVIVTFLIVNVIIGMQFHDRTYPKTAITGVPVGNTPYSKLAGKLQDKHPLPASLKFVHGKQSVSVKTSELGVTFDRELAEKHAGDGRSLLPIVNLFTHHNLPAPIQFNDKKLQATAKKLSPKFYTPPKAARITWEKNNFKVVADVPGAKLAGDSLKDAISRGLTNNKITVDVPLTVISVPNKMTDKETDEALADVRPQLAASVTLTYQGKKVAAQPQDRANWFIQSGKKFVLSQGAVRGFVQSAGKRLFGVTPSNLDAATASAVQNVQSGKSANVELKKFAKTRTFTYCTAVRGVSTSYLSGFNQLIASVYADARGWSLDGQVTFQHASTGCNFTVWLSSAAQMHTFGAICDSTWDCNIGKNVVANFDRWQNATSSWNAAHPGGALTDYRTMLINHETGHQLGFYDNYTCGGKGQPAPIMLQQSIDLKGCVFNVWPLPSEIAAVRPMIGL